MASAPEWSLSPDGSRNPSSIGVMKFITWCRVVIDKYPKNPDLSPDNISELEAEIEKICVQLQRIAYETKIKDNASSDLVSDGVPFGKWKGPVREIRTLMKKLVHKDAWKETVNADKPWQSSDKKVFNPDSEHMTSQYDAFSGNSFSYYKGKPKDVVIDLRIIKQGDRFGFQGQLEAYRIHALSSVPSIDPLISDAEFAKRTAENKHPANEWQRQLQPDNVDKIAAFLDREDSYLFNEILLHANLDNASLSLEVGKGKKTAKLTVDYGFMDELAEDLYAQVDLVEQEDLRPLWIVDGQHRVRGASISERGHALQFPVFITVSGEESGEFGLSEGEVAKLFSEINTTAKPLAEEHRYYAGNRFSIPSLKQWDFGPDGIGNSAAYELACRLCCDEDGALYNAIRLTPKLGSREDGRIVTTIKTWMGKVSGWLAKYHNNDKERQFSEVQAYYDGLMNVCNSSQNGENGWDTKVISGKDKNLFRNTSPFESTYALYPYVRAMAFFLSRKDSHSSEEEDWLDTGDFERAMNPWSNIPFRNLQLKNALNARDNTTPNYRRTWLLQFLWASHLGKMCGDCSEMHMSDEIECESCGSDNIIKFVTPTKEEIISREESGKLGKGVLSPPEKIDLKIEHGSPNLPITDDVTLFFLRPWGTVGDPLVRLEGILDGSIEDFSSALEIIPVKQDFSGGQGWNIADLDEGRLKGKQVCQISIDSTKIPSNLTKLHLSAHFPGASREISDAEPAKFEFSIGGKNGV